MPIKQVKGRWNISFNRLKRVNSQEIKTTNQQNKMTSFPTEYWEGVLIEGTFQSQLPVALNCPAGFLSCMTWIMDVKWHFMTLFSPNPGPWFQGPVGDGDTGS